MKRYRCYICTWIEPLNGWYADLTVLEMTGYRLAGYIVGEVGG
jgi:hypothetical protein